MSDTVNKNERELEIKSIIKNLNLENKVFYLTDYNSCGTIKALFNIFYYLKNIYKSSNNKFIDVNNIYIALFEEDFMPVNKEWLKTSILNLTDDFFYIGEGIEADINNNDFCQLKITPNRGNKIKNNNKIECWTDGGYYFSNLQKLNTIYNKIGIFHKGDTNIKYNHLLDGIELGEVGFPTLLYNNDMQFIGLNRTKYFIHKDY
jgi:hypothetical protein